MNNLSERLLNEMQKNTKNGIYHLTQIKFAYNSNHIEGNTLTHNQTKQIFDKAQFVTDGKASVKMNDIYETVNHFEAFDFILKNIDKKIDISMMKKLHKILKDKTSDEIIGDFKKRPNYIGEFTLTTHPKDVTKKLEKICEKYNSKNKISLNDIVEFHYNFEKIHPFEDGNGRVGRLLMFKECLKWDITPFIIEDENKEFYYRGLKEYKNQKGFLRDTCLLSQDNYSEIVRYFLEDKC
ncbi:MAG: cAMP-induced filamentation protein [Arcobacter sp.]|nr:MAG: cAMP-induced filamentation protein [Arcobacter sp.]